MRIIGVLCLAMVAGQGLKSWNPAITETVKVETDSSQNCYNEGECRQWNSIRNIAMCKAGQLQALMDTELPDHTLFYTETTLKTQEADGWSKFLFSVISKDNHDRTHMVKVCVPTQKVKNSWLSGMCVWEPCGEPERDQECMKRMDGARFKQVLPNRLHVNRKERNRVNALHHKMQQRYRQGHVMTHRVVPTGQC